MYFSGATVVLTNQRGMAKPKLGLVAINTGPVKRPHMPNYSQVDGVLVGNYPSRMTLTIDLFTHGSPVRVSNKIRGYEDSSVDDMLSFADFLNSIYVTEWCRLNDVSFTIEGDVQCLSGIINETTYEYRSRMNVLVYFMEKAVGKTAVLLEESIRYPVYLRDENGNIIYDENGYPMLVLDPDTGEPLYTDTPPVETDSRSGGWQTDAEVTEAGSIVQPEFAPTSTGGGSEELASVEDGYFTEVDEIKEEEF